MDGDSGSGLHVAAVNIAGVLSLRAILLKKDGTVN